MEVDQQETIKSLQSKIAILKADRDDLYIQLAASKQCIQSLHSDIGQIMEFIVDKRKDLSFIGPEFGSIIKNDAEAMIHEIEFDFPNIHSLVIRDFEAALEQNSGIGRLRWRGEALFKSTNTTIVRAVYSDISEVKLNSYLDIVWKQMTFYEKKNWLEKRVVYSRTQEGSPVSEKSSPEIKEDEQITQEAVIKDDDRCDKVKEEEEDEEVNQKFEDDVVADLEIALKKENEVKETEEEGHDTDEHKEEDKL